MRISDWSSDVCSSDLVVDEAMAARIMTEIVEPTVAGMAAEGRPFRGVLYAGLMIGAAGPRLIEYNVRFGDPECQALMLRVQSDMLAAMLAVAYRPIPPVALRRRDETALNSSNSG